MCVFRIGRGEAAGNERALVSGEIALEPYGDGDEIRRIVVQTANETLMKTSVPLDTPTPSPARLPTMVVATSAIRNALHGVCFSTAAI